jgi:hypothetical protein
MEQPPGWSKKGPQLCHLSPSSRRIDWREREEIAIEEESEFRERNRDF